MPIPLVAQHHPDDFQILTFNIRAFSNGDLLFYADRDIVIDSITFGLQTTGGTGATLQLAKTTTATTSNPAARSRAMRETTAAIRSTEPTELPPYF